MVIKTKHLIIFLLLTAIAAVIFLNKKQTEKPVVQKKIEKIKQVGALGQIEPRSRVLTVSHDAGPDGARINMLYVKEGDDIKKGDIVASFSGFGRAKTAIDIKLARLPVLEATLKNEKVNLTFVEKEFTRVTKLLKNKAISKSNFDLAERNYYQAQAKIQEIAAEIDSANREIVLAREELEQSIARSPINGTILKITSWPGERISDDGIAKIANLEELDVVAQIYERDMPRVQTGQQAEIYVPGMGEIFHGEVYQLGFLVEKNDLNNTDPLADRDNRVVETRIRLEPKAIDKLRHLIFMQVDVKIL